MFMQPCSTGWYSGFGLTVVWFDFACTKWSEWSCNGLWPSCFGFRPQSGAKSNQHRNRDLGFKTFSRAWHRFHVFFPHSAPVACFRALGTGYTFSCAWHRLHVFPRLKTPAACFLALGTSCIFSPRKAPVTCFRALGSGCVCFRVSYPSHVFPRLATVVHFFYKFRLFHYVTCIVGQKRSWSNVNNSKPL